MTAEECKLFNHVTNFEAVLLLTTLVRRKRWTCHVDRTDRKEEFEMCTDIMLSASEYKNRRNSSVDREEQASMPILQSMGSEGSYYECYEHLLRFLLEVLRFELRSLGWFPLPVACTRFGIKLQ
jgi:hypothetical protein